MTALDAPRASIASRPPARRVLWRIVAMLLALLLPLQFAWGAAAAYCQHETSAAASQHFGHHGHVHEVDGKKATDTPPLVDNDCNACHAVGSIIAGAAGSVIEAPVGARRPALPEASAYPSAFARAPDRPQWLRLA